MAEHAARVGVEAICCVPPFFYKPSDEALVEHYRVVAAAANLPFFVYNLPQSTGTEITPELMQKIQARVPQLTGLKHSAVTFSYVRDFAKMGLACIIGNSALMLPGLTLGATGCIDGPPNMAPELWVEIWQAYQAGDLKRAEAAQDRATEVTNLVRQFGLHATTKVVIGARLGIDCGDPRPPGLPLTTAQRQQVLARAAALGLTRVTVGAKEVRVVE
jgi:dihydrodipicolinate synthase/N-acetylneuraminate lyase